MGNLTSIMITFCIGIALYMFSIQSVVKQSNPEKELLEEFVVQNNVLSFEGEDLNNLSGNYKVTLPESIKISKDDTVHFSYKRDRGYVKRIREVYVNDKLVWNTESKDKIEFSEIKQ